MKIKVLVPFYRSDTGLVKRGETELPDKIAKQLIAEGLAEENERESKPASKSKNSTKSRNKRV